MIKQKPSAVGAELPVEDLSVVASGNEVKVRLFINGGKYAFRCSKQDFERLLTEEGEVIRKVSF